MYNQLIYNLSVFSVLCEGQTYILISRGRCKFGSVEPQGPGVSCRIRTLKHLIRIGLYSKESF